jgi:hypothetical protein
MRAKILRGVIALACVGGLAFTAAGGASAATAKSKVSGFSANGVTYTADASVATGSKWAQGHSYIGANKTVAAGWMGANGRLFNSRGALVKEGGYQYNSVSAIGRGGGSGTYYYSGTYYSHGIVRAWNGNSYNAHYTYKSPSLNA